MTRAWRTSFAALACGAAACVPILGLDDVREKPVAITDGGGSDAAPMCTTNTDCIKDSQGNPSLCVSGKCVDVNPQYCLSQVRPDNALLEDPNVIVVAAFMRGATPLQTGPGLAYELALQELSKVQEGIGRAGKRFAMLVCNSDPGKVKDSFNHVVHELRLPAILASFGSGDLADLVRNDAVEAGTFTMNPSFTTDVLKFSKTERRVWSLLGTPEDVARAYRPVLHRLKADKLGGPAANIKVAVIATNGSLDKPMADLIELGQRQYTGDGGFDTSKALDMNGSPPSPANFRRWEIDSEELEVSKRDPAKIENAKTQVVEWDPDVIIALTGSEIEKFLVEIDTGIISRRADAGTPRKTYWILGPSNGAMVLGGGKKTVVGTYLDFDAPDVDARRERFLGVQYSAQETKERELFHNRMTVEHGEAGAEGFNSENFYDAIYWLAYGFAAAGPDPEVNGTSFSKGVRKLIEGERLVYTGDPETIRRSIIEINEYKELGTTFVGALGPPNINEPTGTWNSVGALYCYPPRLEFQPTPKYEVGRYLPDGGLSEFPSITCSN